MTHPLAALIAEKANDARDVFDGTCDTAKQSVDYFEQLLLAALEAEVKVKPLVWEEDFADHPFGWYETIDCGDCIVLTQSGVTVGSFPTADAAHDAAQVDYEARTLAALEAAPVPDLADVLAKAEKIETDLVLCFNGSDHVLEDAADTIRALVALATAQAAQIAGLQDPVAVHANMLRGTIAKPTAEQIMHLYGRDALITALAPDLEAKAESWRNDYRALEKAIVGETGLSAMTVATQARLFRPRAETAEAKVAELEAQIAGMIDADTVQKMLDSAQPIMAEACRGYEETIADLQADAATLRAEVERLRGALQWCSGSDDFQDGGKAREGWLKLCAPLLIGEGKA